jgi:hypothetical protein
LHGPGATVIGSTAANRQNHPLRARIQGGADQLTGAVGAADASIAVVHGINCKPLASAISMIAVWLSGNQHHRASTREPNGPQTAAQHSALSRAASTA